MEPVASTKAEKDQARLIMDFYKEMGYAAMAIGSQDLAGSLPFLLEEAKKRGLLLLSANLRYQGKEVVAPYRIFKVGEARIGVLAITSPDINPKLKNEGIGAFINKSC